MMAVQIQTSGEPGIPKPLFDTHITGGAGPRAYQYDVTGDGNKFLVATSGGSSCPVLTVEVNSLTSLK